MTRPRRDAHSEATFPPSDTPPGRGALFAVLALATFLGLVALIGSGPGLPGAGPGTAPGLNAPGSTAASTPRSPEVLAPTASGPAPAPPLAPLTILPGTVLTARDTLPGGRHRVFGGSQFLVAYYGTAGTGSLGTLGETGVDTAHERLMRAARPFRRDGETIQPVYELIVTVADAIPGPGRDFSHDIARRLVEPYVRAAHRHGALLLLDLQPGRTDFLTVARRWEWALRDPWVGLALDPEWRMGRREVPGRVIGRVGAAEVNRTSAWLARLTHRFDLPEKLFVLHQFRSSMLRDPAAIRERKGLAMVQHVDGFGTPRQKLSTYHSVARPRQFAMGFKLFYDEDRRRMRAGAVRAIEPPVRFVSFQ